MSAPASVARLGAVPNPLTPLIGRERLLPGADASIATTRYADWLEQTAVHA
jgi:hypothetical protein